MKLKIIEDNLILTSKGEVSSGIVCDYFKDLIGLKKVGFFTCSNFRYIFKTIGYYEFGWFF